jgi:hypothetical protein
VDTGTLAMIVAAVGLGITVIDKIWTGSWSLSSKITKMERGLRQAILDSKREIEERQDEHIQQVGTTLTVFRDKFREIELYIRDNYIKGPDFLHAMKQHTDISKAYQDAIIARLDRIEKKSDDHNPTK